MTSPRENLTICYSIAIIPFGFFDQHNQEGRSMKHLFWYLRMVVALVISLFSLCCVAEAQTYESSKGVSGKIILSFAPDQVSFKGSRENLRQELVGSLKAEKGFDGTVIVDIFLVTDSPLLNRDRLVLKTIGPMQAGQTVLIPTNLAMEDLPEGEHHVVIIWGTRDEWIRGETLSEEKSYVFPVVIQPRKIANQTP